MATATVTAIATPNNSKMKEMQQSTGGDGDGNYDGAVDGWQLQHQATAERRSGAARAKPSNSPNTMQQNRG